MTRADEGLVGEEEQAAEWQLGQAHRVHHRVHAGSARGQIREVHRAVVPCE